MKTDLLEWWAENDIKFPALSVMARQYLGVPATSASAERLFSIAGRSFDDLRQRMKEEMLEMLMWARINRETRQAKCYFTDVSFNPKTFKKKSRDAAAAKGQQTIAPPPAKKAKVMEPSNAPPAPKPEEAAKPPAAPADEIEDREVEDWYAKATTPPVPAS